MSRILSRAPSNIALIKYMGKKDGGGNIPENASISLTLDSLCTWAEVRRSGAGLEFRHGLPDVGAARSSLIAPKLSEEAVERVTRYASRVVEAAAPVLERFEVAVTSSREGFEIRTANTFPHSSGIASSASSFAAVTLGVAAALAADADQFNHVYQTELGLRRALAEISRTGSGSSCRSFEGPWTRWEDQSVAAIETKMPALVDFVLLISRNPKSVSSSSAHARVKSSPLWKERVERVAEREKKMRAALSEGNIGKVSYLAWSEAWEMHSLFHTSTEPFSYWEPGTIETLHWLAGFLKEEAPPIVTLDAGPNVHLLVEESKAALWRTRLEQRFGSLFLENMILIDKQGYGASFEVLSETSVDLSGGMPGA